MTVPFEGGFAVTDREALSPWTVLTCNMLMRMLTFIQLGLDFSVRKRGKDSFHNEI